MKIRITTSCNDRIDAIQKKRSDGCTACRQDLGDVFADDKKSFDDYWISVIPLRELGHVRISKFRFANSKNNKGKSAGYRCIAELNSQTQEITILYVYPKAGKYKQETVSDNELDDILDSYFLELQAGSIIDVDPKNNLNPVEVKDKQAELRDAVLLTNITVEDPSQKEKEE